MGSKMPLPLILACLFTIVVWAATAHAQGREKASEKDSAPVSSCDQFLPAKKQVGERSVGPDECRIVSDEVVFNIKGQKFQRLELRISGTLEGWAVKQGARTNYFNDAPDLIFTQSGNSGPRFKGIGRYDAATGHGMSLFFPENPADWNGKLFVTAHGAGPYGAIGTLAPRSPNADFNPLANLNRYAGLMLDRGYAVAHTLRSTQIAGGDVAVTLDDGTILPKNNISSHAGFLIDLTRTAENVLQQKLGRKSERTYFYGFSAGAMLGRHVQYQPGLNKGDDGRPVFDGFLLDDAGGGMWLPVLMVDGKDTLFAGDDKKRFVPQIDLTHQLYLGDSNDFLQKKRENAKILKQKALADKHRMYEIRGVSHFDAGQASLPDLVPQTLDLGGLVASFLDILDRWVEKGETPQSGADRRPRQGRRHERQRDPRQARDPCASLGQARAVETRREAYAGQIHFLRRQRSRQARRTGPVAAALAALLREPGRCQRSRRAVGWVERSDTHRDGTTATTGRRQKPQLMHAAR